MTLFRSVLVALACIITVQLAGAQQKSTIAILSKSKHDGVWLRWAPTSPTLWQLGNKYGYSIERFAMTPEGELESGSRAVLTPSPLKPYTLAEFLPLSERSDEVATLEELLYGEDFKTTFSANDISSVLRKNNELENRFGIAMLMCDLSLDAAQAGGLFFKDTKAVQGKRYIYRIGIPYTLAGKPVEPSVIIVSAEDEKPLASIKDLKAQFSDKTASISWSTLLHKGVYSAYYIEKSEDGKNFKKLTDLPYVHMSEKLNDETAYYVDSLAVNQKKYYYRIQGISPFAETGPVSNIVSGEGTEPLFGKLVLRSGKVLVKRQVSVVWEFPKEFEDQIAGFMVSRAGNPDGPYNDAFKKSLAKDKREYIDITPHNNTYYVIRAMDKDGKEVSRSFPYLVQIEDNTPPAIPTTIAGSIEKTGVTRLTWASNKDADLLGYRVFRSNSSFEEPVEVTRDILSQPAFTDTVNIRVLNKKIYYTVIAVDKNFNTSGYSIPFVLSRPDILPPTAPVFTRVELTKDSITLEWTNSVSDDIAKYEFTRIEKTSKLTRVLTTFYPSAVQENYKDRSLTPGHVYAYKITAYDSAGNTSEALSRDILFEPGFRSAVSNIKSTVDREQKKITLEWKNSTPGVKCIVYRKINESAFSIYQTLEGNVENFTDKDIRINNLYGYKVQLIHSKGVKSILSSELTVQY
jgi:uncharacterized protein